MMEFTGERFVPELSGDIKFEHLHRYALALDFVEGRSVLDIASGEGYGSALLAKRAAWVIGVDIDPQSIQHAQTQYHDRPNLEFSLGSCSAIPVADASIDVVVSFETIEHHDQHEEMMQEIKRVLKPDGLLIISSPNRLVYSDEPQYSNPFHVKELYYEELVDLLKRYFQQVQIYGQKLAVSSWVTALGTSDIKNIQAYSGNATALFDSISPLPSPVYFVAICSNRTELPKPLASTYLDGSEDLWRQLHQNWNLDRLRLTQLQQNHTQLQQDHAQLQQNHTQLQQDYAQLQQDLIQAQDQQKSGQSQLEVAHTQIKAMESSKFWKLRQGWIRIKGSLRNRKSLHP